MKEDTSTLRRVLRKHQSEILSDWIQAQRADAATRPELVNPGQVQEQSRQFLSLLAAAVENGRGPDVMAPEWADLRNLLADASRSRARQGYTPVETAMFVFSLKSPLFGRLREECGPDVIALGDAVWTASLVIDRLGLWTTEVHQKSREEIILRQQEEMLELSTPVVELWDDVLALPLIGTLDSARTQVVMESLLQKIVDSGAAIAIIDITGVPTVDTLVAQHLLKTVAAARLMGADCIISGIRPQIAQTIVHLGVELANVVTKATLADAFVLALERTGASIARPRTPA
jgi:rsbT co-antagonist protein RsbR